MQTLIGQKKVQSQRFLENGKRIPVTLIDVKGNTIVSVKTQEKNNYQAVQLGFSMKKKASKAEIGHVKGAKLEKAPKFLREVRIIDDSEVPVVGTVLDPMEVFEPGDMVDISGISKGKGFQGGVKRYGFRGGPKTHGQSDRHRAPGSIGAGTTPGRVYKGKRMAGNMGNDNVTIKNLEVIDITADGVLVIKGLVPGIIDGLIMVNKTGKDKNFVPLYKSPEEKAADEAASKAQNVNSVEAVAEAQNLESGEAAAMSEDVAQNIDSGETKIETPFDNGDEVKVEADDKEESGTIETKTEEDEEVKVEAEEVKEEVKEKEDARK